MVTVWLTRAEFRQKFRQAVSPGTDWDGPTPNGAKSHCTMENQLIEEDASWHWQHELGTGDLLDHLCQGNTRIKNPVAVVGMSSIANWRSICKTRDPQNQSIDSTGVESLITIQASSGRKSLPSKGSILLSRTCPKLKHVCCAWAACCCSN